MKKPDLAIPSYKSRQFTFERPKDCAVEASDLGCTAGVAAGRQVWSDACDIGFTMTSDKTGTEKLFTLASERRNADNELEAWIFVSEDGFTATIYND